LVVRFEDMELSSVLTKEPRHHPDCCVALSTRLLESLVEALPPSPSLVASIGSGTGMLEAALQLFAGPSINLCGVEVSTNVNKYLPEEDIFSVGGTWDLFAGAVDAEALIFVYPREVSLLERYIHLNNNGRRLRKIIWLGPKSDWPDYEPVLLSSIFKDITVIKDGSITATYEMMCIAHSSLEA
jgi:hypothetical protein